MAKVAILRLGFILCYKLKNQKQAYLLFAKMLMILVIAEIGGLHDLCRTGELTGEKLKEMMYSLAAEVSNSRRVNQEVQQKLVQQLEENEILQQKLIFLQEKNETTEEKSRVQQRENEKLQMEVHDFQEKLADEQKANKELSEKSESKVAQLTQTIDQLKAELHTLMECLIKEDAN